MRIYVIFLSGVFAVLGCKYVDQLPKKEVDDLHIALLCFIVPCSVMFTLWVFQKLIEFFKEGFEAAEKRMKLR